MKKKDLILIAVLLVIAGGVFLGYRLMHKDAGNYCRVTVDGKEYAKLPLDEDKELVIEGVCGFHCTLSLVDGSADVISSECPDKICRDHAPVSRNGEAIVCLPAKIVITIISDQNSDVDVIV